MLKIITQRSPAILPLLVIGCFYSVSAHAFPPAPIQQTGQTSCYDPTGAAINCTGTGQDGELKTGMPWPIQRFTDNANGTVTDNLTGLIWLKLANCYSTQTWETAVASARTLASGSCGLTDSSTAGQWRLPSRNELESLVNLQQANPDTWLDTQGFTTVKPFISGYWSGSTRADYTTAAAYVVIRNGVVDSADKASASIGYVWPVRSGQ